VLRQAVGVVKRTVIWVGRQSGRELRAQARQRFEPSAF
jgi:hypothetical protein